MKQSLQNFLSGVSKYPQQIQSNQSNPRSERKNSTLSSPPSGNQIDEPQRDVNLYLHLPPNHYKFMIEVDSNMQAKADLLMASMDRVFNIKSSQIIPADFIEDIKLVAKELKQTLKDLRERENDIVYLKEENENLIQSMLTKEHMIHSIESSYLDRFQQIKDDSADELVKCQKEVAYLNTSLSELSAALKHKEQIEADLLERLGCVERERESLSKELQISRDTIQKLNDELDIYKDIRTGSLIINNIYSRLVDPFKMIKEPALFYLFTGRFRNQMVSYLTPDDILNLMLTSRKLYFILRNNRTLVQHVIKCKTLSICKMLHEAKQEANYFNEMADRIPEEILQQGLAKFLAFRFQAGSYLNEVFKDVWEFLEGRFEGGTPLSVEQDSQQQHQQQQQQQKATYEELFQKDEVETTDLIGLEDDSYIKRSQSEILPSQQLQQTSYAQQQQPPLQSNNQSSFFSKLKNLAGVVNPPPPLPPQSKTPAQSITLAQLSQQLQSELSSLGSICTKALSIPFLKQQLRQSRDDMVELSQRTSQINHQLYNLGQKCIQSNNVQEFLKRQQSTFARLLANAHYLRLECQQLQHTTHYLAQMVLKQNKQLAHNATKSEDIQEECKTLRAMNVFIQGRMKQLEERVHKGEENVLAFSKDNIELKQQSKVVQCEMVELRSKVKDKEQKLKVLALSLKQMSHDKQQLQRSIQSINQGLATIRAVLPLSISTIQE